MDRILIIIKKNNGHQGIICPFTGAFFHNMQTCLLVYTYNRSQVSVYRTIGPLVIGTIFSALMDWQLRYGPGISLFVDFSLVYKDLINTHT